MKIFHSNAHRLRDSKFEIHDGEVVHPFERPERMDFIIDALIKRGFDAPISPPFFDLSIASKLHRKDYLEFLQTAYDEWRKDGKKGEAMSYIWPAVSMRQDVIPDQIEAKIGYYSLSSDTTITQGSWKATLASKDCAEAAAQALIDGERASFALARPPGHHASSFQFGGYCFLNNAAIAAERILQNGAKRVSILDVDFHHGNGTQEIFYNRADVQFLSLHGDPKDCFPYFLGYADETGHDAGEGFNVNYPLPIGTAYSEWKLALINALEKVKTYQPDAVIISLGVDTYEHDPISAFKLKSEDFIDYGALLANLNLPTAFIMEGGYAIDAIGTNTVNVLEGYLQA